MNTTALRYAGFGRRLASLLLDIIIMAPLVGLVFWGSSYSRLFWLYAFVPNILFGLYYYVYLVQRYGGTPGKLLAGIRIRKVAGGPVGYREAFLRHLPQWGLGMLTTIAIIVATLQMTDAEYHARSLMERHKRMAELTPVWLKPVKWVQSAWVWGELLVLLTNRKRRALHDFIAGTVVVCTDKRSGRIATAPPNIRHLIIGHWLGKSLNDYAGFYTFYADGSVQCEVTGPDGPKKTSGSWNVEGNTILAKWDQGDTDTIELVSPQQYRWTNAKNPNAIGLATRR